MAKTKVLLFREQDKTVPLLKWFECLPFEMKTKCLAKIELLASVGHDLRRPHADYLRDGIYELRVRVRNVHYRILYFFFKNAAIVLSHGTTKKDRVPPGEIDKAVMRKSLFEKNPFLHSHSMELDNE